MTNEVKALLKVFRIAFSWVSFAFAIMAILEFAYPNIPGCGWYVYLIRGLFFELRSTKVDVGILKDAAGIK